MVKNIETATPIERVCVARQGTVAVLMKEDDVSYVRLYDKKGQELASGEFYQEKGSFPVDIALAPDAQKLAVDMLDVTKGKTCSTVTFYNFGSVGQNEIDNNVGTYSYKNTMISELVYTESGKLLAISDAGLIWFDGAQKPAPKKQIKFEREIQSVFYNNKYVGISYSDTQKENSWHIKVYDMNGKTVMENDTEIAYNRIELLDNNEICVRDDYNCELFTIHSIRKFRYRFVRLAVLPLFDLLGGLPCRQKIIRYLRINILTRASKCAIILLQRKVESSISTGHLPQIGARMRSRNILMVFYPTGAAHGLTARCAAARHGPSRELGPCPKELDGLSCMHQAIRN